METFQKGQRAKLADLTGGGQVLVGVEATGTGGETVDVRCVGLDATGKPADASWVLSAAQPASPEGSVSAREPGNDAALFLVELDQVPSTVDRLSFTLIVSGGRGVAGLSGRFHLQADGADVMSFPLSAIGSTNERAAIVGDLYRKDGWRVAAMGRGYADEGALNAKLGVTAPASPAPPPVAPSAPPPPLAPPGSPAPAAPPPPGAPPPSAPPAPSAPPSGPPAASAPTTGGVQLGKVTLDKKGESRAVSLHKDGGTQPLHFNLNWDQTGSQKRGLLSRVAGGSGNADLDLGCMFEMADGTKNVIQPLGGYFGDRERSPYIYLDKDDRTGASAEGENLWVLRPDLVRRVMVFALIYEGATDFTSVGAHLTIRDQEGNDTFVELGSPDPGLRVCGIATVHNEGDRVSITKEERYFRSARQADGDFGFGFRWKAGRK